MGHTVKNGRHPPSPKPLTICGDSALQTLKPFSFFVIFYLICYFRVRKQRLLINFLPSDKFGFLQIHVYTHIMLCMEFFFSKETPRWIGFGHDGKYLILRMLSCLCFPEQAEAGFDFRRTL